LKKINEFEKVCCCQFYNFFLSFALAGLSSQELIWNIKFQVSHSQSSLAVLGIFSHEKITILWSNVIVFTYECQAGITMADIKQRYKSKIFFKCVIFRSKILQRLRFSLISNVNEAPAPSGYWLLQLIFWVAIPARFLSLLFLKFHQWQIT
jgi:hypothetical protein